MRQRVQRKKKVRQRLPVLIVIALIVVFSAAFLIGELIRFRMPSRERADLEALYGAEDGYASVLVNHEWSESQAFWDGGHAYLPYEAVRDELNARFCWDPTEKILLYTLPEEVVRAEENTVYEGVPVFLEREDGIWLSLSYVEHYSNILVEYYENPARIVLQTQWGSEQIGSVGQDTEVRVLGGIKSAIVTEVKKGGTVTILDSMDTWSEVQTEDGYTGYLLNSALTDLRTVETTGPSAEPDYTGTPVDYDICLLWHQVIGTSGLDTLVSFLETDTPVTTMAPTWFSILSEDGSFQSSADREYVTRAHQAGKDVWPVVENVNHTDVDMTALLSSTTARNRLITGILVELEECGADGLNVDLENIPEEAGDGYIQLIRELSVECRKRGLVLSVDDGVPSAWTEHYNRREQGVMADYVIIMGYDEHYSGSEPGSTASLPFVQSGIEDTLEEVPAGKVVNGIPFYTRIWTETDTSLTSEAVGMETALQFVGEHGGNPEWLSDVGQNYVRMEEGDTVYQIWLEDEESMEVRLNRMQSYDLAGAAFWKLGMQSDGIWELIEEYYPARE